MSARDILVLVRGTTWRFMILRQTSDCYGFRGMAHVHGTAKDELRKGCEDLDKEQEEFGLC